MAWQSGEMRIRTPSPCCTKSKAFNKPVDHYYSTSPENERRKRQGKVKRQGHFWARPAAFDDDCNDTTPEEAMEDLPCPPHLKEEMMTNCDNIDEARRFLDYYCPPPDTRPCKHEGRCPCPKGRTKPKADKPANDPVEGIKKNIEILKDVIELTESVATGDYTPDPSVLKPEFKIEGPSFDQTAQAVQTIKAQEDCNGIDSVPQNIQQEFNEPYDKNAQKYLQGAVNELMDSMKIWTRAPQEQGYCPSETDDEELEEIMCDPEPVTQPRDYHKYEPGRIYYPPLQYQECGIPGVAGTKEFSFVNEAVDNLKQQFLPPCVETDISEESEPETDISCPEENQEPSPRQPSSWVDFRPYSSAYPTPRREFQVYQDNELTLARERDLPVFPRRQPRTRHTLASFSREQWDCFNEELGTCYLPPWFNPGYQAGQGFCNCLCHLTGMEENCACYNDEFHSPRPKSHQHLYFLNDDGNVCSCECHMFYEGYGSFTNFNAPFVLHELCQVCHEIEYNAEELVPKDNCTPDCPCCENASFYLENQHC